MAGAVNGPVIRMLGRLIRLVGKVVDDAGVSLQGKNAYTERVVPSTRSVAFRGKSLTYGYQNFVASTASVVGDVSMGEMSSAWYGAVLRGDQNTITIGRNSALLENAVVGSAKGSPTQIGSEVVVSPGASVTGAHIGDGAMIGMGAVVQPRARIGNDSFIDAGAVVVAGTVVPPGTLWTGAPARQLRALKPEEMSYLRTMATLYGELSQRHYEQERKAPREVEAEEELRLLRRELRLKPAEPVPTVPADVIEYYNLTERNSEVGLLRGAERDDAAEAALREAEEVAADHAENAMYAQAARLRRVGAALKAIAAARPDRPAQRAGTVAELASRDPEGAALLADFVAQAADAAAPGKDAAKARMLAVIASIDAQASYYADEKEALDAAEKIFAAAVAHAPELAKGDAATAMQGGAGAGAARAAKPLA